MTSAYDKKLIGLISFAVGVLAANIYYAQPILAPLATSLGLRPDAAGLIMTFTQVGYGLGVLFAVPLGDLFENKKLILTLISVAILAELILGVAQAPGLYLAASILVGLGTSAVQIIVPYTTHLYEKGMRGQVIGTLMSGLMLGIMFSRPLSSLMTEYVSLHSVFFASAGIMALLFWRLAKRLPARVPETSTLNYGQLIWSMKELLIYTPTLRRRALYQAFMFGSFCLFWTTAPLMLIHSEFHFSQKGVALFALAGLAGAIAAPYAGKMADAGKGRLASLLSMAVALVAFVIGHFIHEGALISLVVLVIAANLLDAGVSAHLVLGQRAIFMIDPKNQSRLNGLYLAIIYIGGAAGSALGAWAYLHGGWPAATWIGIIFSVLALVLISTERFFGYREA